MSLYSPNFVYRPSFFELLASDRLIFSLKPAFKFALGRLAGRFSSFDRLLKFDEELFHLLLLLLESHYLRHFSASFSENFYGLVRVAIRENGGPEEFFGSESRVGGKLHYLNNRQRIGALIALVALPYVKARLSSLFSSLLSSSEDSQFLGRPASASPAVEIFLKVFPYAHAFSEALKLFFQFRYLFGSGDSFFDLTGAALGQTHRRISGEDLKHFNTIGNRKQDINSLDSAWQEIHRPSWILFLDRLHALNGVFVSSAKWAVVLSIFAYKFYDWLRHSRGNSVSSVFSSVVGDENLPIPPPPLAPEPASDGISLHPNKSFCSLCNRPRTNPASSPSGYVFCYPCLFQFVADRGQCPVTKNPCKTEQIRKIYEN